MLYRCDTIEPEVIHMKQTLWRRNFTLLTLATALGAAGGIAGGFALSFLVFDETGSTLASALILALQVIPGLVIPLLAAPWMDRMPRKPFLVGGDLLNGLLYALMGLYLLRFRFSYAGYLAYSLLLLLPFANFPSVRLPSNVRTSVHTSCRSAQSALL